MAAFSDPEEAGLIAKEKSASDRWQKVAKIAKPALVLFLAGIIIVTIAATRIKHSTASDSYALSDSDSDQLPPTSSSNPADGDTSQSIHRISWNLSWIQAAPDGFSRPVIASNGVFPIPKVTTTVGDTIQLTVTNSLDTPILIHFHGTKNSINYDGSPATQCAILPTATFTYVVDMVYEGTYLIHGHTAGLQTDGLAAMLIVKPVERVSLYDRELSFLISDWFHEEYIKWSAKSMNAVNHTHSILAHSPVSGLVNFGREMAEGGVKLEAGKVFRIRIACMAAQAGFFFSVDGHDMSVIEVDGASVEPLHADSIEIGSGQRYSILIQTKPSGNGTNMNYNFRLTMQTSEFVHPQHPLTLLKLYYDTSSVDFFKPLKTYTSGTLDELKLIPTSKTRLGLPSVRFVLDFTGGGNLGFNHTIYTTPSIPTLYTALAIGATAGGLDSTGYGDVNPLVVPELDSIVEIVVTSRDADPHPVHLHGHRFQVVYASVETPMEKYIPGWDYDSTKKNPSLWRDTVMVPAKGFVVLRFKADSPGAWLLHCHLPMHSDLGMAVTVVEAPKEMAKFKIPPANLALCNYK
ncbi:multicopper oxidase-domain-containing protein [Obelidium mucronatum]|nr:multicopper oxidase-domain-containing protein [Obelidium mucronatum]